MIAPDYGSLTVASSAFAFELLARLDTGQRNRPAQASRSQRVKSCQKLSYWPCGSNAHAPPLTETLEIASWKTPTSLCPKLRVAPTVRGQCNSFAEHHASMDCPIYVPFTAAPATNGTLRKSAPSSSRNFTLPPRRSSNKGEKSGVIIGGNRCDPPLLNA
jgi:hypothetical protein